MRAILSFGLLLFFFSAQAQQLRINLMAGRANYSGELQPRPLTFNQSNGAYGAGASLDLTNKLSLRGEFFFTKLGADDKLTSKPEYRLRNLNFKTYIQELNLVAEYNFLNHYEHKLVPYVFGGIGVFRFSPYTTDSLYGKRYLAALSTEGQGLPGYPGRQPYKTTQINIPFGGGVKYFLSDDINFSMEMGVRTLSTDYLDDVSTTYVDEAALLAERGPVAVGLAFRGDEVKSNPQAFPGAGIQRGSPKAKDYYYYGLLKIGIRMNWFGVDDASGKRGKVNCPPRVL